MMYKTHTYCLWKCSHILKVWPYFLDLAQGVSFCDQSSASSKTVRPEPSRKNRSQNSVSTCLVSGGFGGRSSLHTIPLCDIIPPFCETETVPLSLARKLHLKLKGTQPIWSPKFIKWQTYLSFFPSYADPCLSVLGSSVLRRFSGGCGLQAGCPLLYFHHLLMSEFIL